jgi:hypothetical protein
MENNIIWLRERLESYRQGNDDDGYILIPINRLEILLTQMQKNMNTTIKLTDVINKNKN